MHDDERPSDRLARSWYRGAMYFLGFCCLVGATVALLDERAAVAGAAAGLAVAWIMAARLIFPT